MDPKLAEHHEKIDQLIAERKQQHEFFRHHARLITATAACFTAGVLILGIFYSMMYLPIATEQVNQKLNSDNTPPISPQPTSFQNQDINTANWKTYTNSKYGFSFQYPNNYELAENNYFYPNSLKPNERYPNSKLGSVNIFNSTLTSKKCSYKYHSKNNDEKILSSENTNINLVSGVKELVESKYLGDNGEGYGPLFVNNFCFNKNNINFTVSWFSYNKISTNDNALFDQILSTFKFTQ